MKRLMSCLLAAVILIPGCGYTTKSALPPRLEKIYVAPFKNSISYTSTVGERNVYFPLLEVKIRNAVVDRFLFDGNLKVASDEKTADLVLKGELVDYQRYALRYTDNDDVQEYRILVVTSLVLYDNQKEEVFWQYGRFAGEATYFVTGAQATSEESAVVRATEDLARRIVEKTIENW
ncbi:MAG: LPS assembly lipoprotein LptE [Candidatus Omnitrophota bacterium]